MIHPLRSTLAHSPSRSSRGSPVFRRVPGIIAGCALAVILATAPAIPPAAAAPVPELLLGLPPTEGGGPVVVRADFHLRDINAIDDEEETFEFNGILVLSWNDPRQAFDPAEAGIPEKIYQGNFQFNETAPSWYPQIVLANESGMMAMDAVLLRVRPDGSCTLFQTVDAVAEATLGMRRYPFDRQRLDIVFSVLGFGADEVAFVAGDGTAEFDLRLSQWTFGGIETAVREIAAPVPGRTGVVSGFVVGLDVQRRSVFMLRLVVFPLVLIVVLSWSVFWMDRSSLGDRINLSFVGILTAVAYQIVVGDHLPHVSYFTLMHAFLNLSFVVMCATVVVNLAVGECDKRGLPGLGDRIDRACRWIFPCVYFGLLPVFSAVMFFAF